MFHPINVYYFIDKFDRDEITKLDKNIDIIFRNYQDEINENLVIKIKNTCKASNRKFYLSNNFRLALKFKLDGIYIPSFNKTLSIKHIRDKRLEILGSAHNHKELKIKENQGVDKIFISPVFKTKKKKLFLGPIKFNLLSKTTSKKIIALGGINKKNLKKIKLLNCSGFASISYLKDRIENKNER